MLDNQWRESNGKRDGENEGIKGGVDFIKTREKVKVG